MIVLVLCPAAEDGAHVAADRCLRYVKASSNTSLRAAVAEVKTFVNEQACNLGATKLRVHLA